MYEATWIGGQEVRKARVGVVGVLGFAWVPIDPLRSSIADDERVEIASDPLGRLGVGDDVIRLQRVSELFWALGLAVLGPVSTASDRLCNLTMDAVVTHGGVVQKVCER